MTGGLFLLIIASVGLSAIAQMFLKLGVGRVATAGGSADSITSVLMAYALQPYVILGLSLYGLGAVMWLFVLSRLPLTAAYPFVGLGFVMTMAIGAGLLGEQVTPTRLIGTLLIAAGCVLVARSVA